MAARISRLPGLFVVATLGVVLTVASPAHAEGPVGLGTATSFAVLAGQTVTNTGSSVISGDVGLSPGSAVVGFPPRSSTTAPCTSRTRLLPRRNLISPLRTTTPRAVRRSFRPDQI